MSVEAVVMGTQPSPTIAGEPARESSNAPAPNAYDNTRRLTVIWQQLLGIEPITSDQNYFDLGGDSILAVQLFAQIEREFGLKLPVATLFETPTIAELAQLIQNDAPTAGWSSLVPIQPAGSKPPFFCIHGAGGNVLIYRELALHLGPDQPFFGLQCQGLDGKLPILKTVEEMAALYAKEICRVRPHGPYLIGGYCGGGTIALEVAQQLQAMGEEVALLALFDTSNWCKIPSLSFSAKTYQYGERLVFHALSLFGLDGKGRIQFLHEKFNSVRHRIPVWRGMLHARLAGKSNAEASESRLLSEIWRANDQACTKYVPKPYPGVITDFRPRRQYRMFDRPGVKWDQLAQKGQEVVSLPVYPAGMLVQPFVEQLATALRTRLNNATSAPVAV